MVRRSSWAFLFCCFGWVLSGCSGSGMSAVNVHGLELMGVTAGNEIVKFNTLTPQIIEQSVPIAGLPSNDFIVGADKRPSTGVLYVVTSSSRLFTVNANSGVATQVGTTFVPLLSGVVGAVNFDPTETLRVVTVNGQNLRIDPATALVTVDNPLQYAAGDVNFNSVPQIAAASFSGSTLFGIDTNKASLVTIGGIGGNPPVSGGQLFTKGLLGGTLINSVGLRAISASSAFAVFTRPGGNVPALYSVDLTSGNAQLVGAVGESANFVALTDQ